MELEGSLKAFPLPEVLQFLSMGQMSGHLHLNHEGYAITLTIKAGRIVNSSTLQRSRKLGEMLVQRGVIKRRELDNILSLQKTIESNKRLGEILLERKLVTQKDLSDTVRLQVEEEVWDLFSWDDGNFKFEHGEEEKITDIAVQIDIGPLLLEGSRRQDEWHKIRKVIPSDDVVLELIPPGDDFRRTLKLSPMEWKVLSALDGVHSVEAITVRCSMGRFETCHVLHTFLNQDLIRRREKPPETPPAVIARILERGQALAAPLMVEPAAQRGGLGSLFGGRPKGPEPASGPAASFTAPAILMAAFNTAFMAQTLRQKDFSPRPQDSRLLESLWPQVSKTHPRSDLIEVRDNTVDPSMLEIYILKSEYGPSEQECHEETLEALTQLLRIAYQVASQRMGEKTSQRLIQQILEPAARAALRYGSPFDITGRLTRALSIAA